MRQPRSTPHSSRSARVTNVISVGGCERATGVSAAAARRALDQLEFLAKFQALLRRQIDLQVGVSRIPVRTRAALRGKVHAIFTGEAQLEARGFLAKAKVDQGSHGSLKGLRRLPALKKEPEIASDVTGHLVLLLLGSQVDELARVGEISVERGVGQASFGRALVRIATE